MYQYLYILKIQIKKKKLCHALLWLCSGVLRSCFLSSLPNSAWLLSCCFAAPPQTCWFYPSGAFNRGGRVIIRGSKHGALHPGHQSLMSQSESAPTSLPPLPHPLHLPRPQSRISKRLEHSQRTIFYSGNTKGMLWVTKNLLFISVSKCSIFPSAWKKWNLLGLDTVHEKYSKTWYFCLRMFL